MRTNPYNELKRVAQKFIYSTVLSRAIIAMFTYPKEGLAKAFNLVDLYERTKAADQLGYEVIIVATDVGIEVKYRKRITRSDVPLSLVP